LKKQWGGQGKNSSVQHDYGAQIEGGDDDLHWVILAWKRPDMSFPNNGAPKPNAPAKGLVPVPIPISSSPARVFFQVFSRQAEPGWQFLGKAIWFLCQKFSSSSLGRVDPCRHLRVLEVRGRKNQDTFPPCAGNVGREKLLRPYRALWETLNPDFWIFGPAVGLTTVWGNIGSLIFRPHRSRWFPLGP